MKNKFIVAVIALFFVGFTAQAQSNVKIGYIDVDYVLSEMPEAKEVESGLKTHSAQWQKRIETKTAEYQQKVAKYQQEAPSMAADLRQSTEKELTQLGQTLQGLQQEAQASLQKKQAELMQPLYDKIGEKINEVYTAEGFSHILNARVGGLDVVIKADEKYDISNSVLKKMGVTPKAAAK